MEGNETKIALLESDIHYIKKDLSEMKKDWKKFNEFISGFNLIKALFGMGIIQFLFMAGIAYASITN